MNVERIGLVTIIGGVVAVAVGALLRLFEVAPSWRVDGFTVYKTYPWAAGFFVVGIVIAVVGVVVWLIGRARRRSSAQS